MDKEQWHLPWTGEQAFWQAVPRFIAAGHGTVAGLTEPRKSSTGQPYKIPRLMAAQDGECTQTLRIVLSRGIAGIDERTRGLAPRWFDMVDWRSATVGSAQSGAVLTNHAPIHSSPFAGPDTSRGQTERRGIVFAVTCWALSAQRRCYSTGRCT
jgi:hypothetical protein